MEPREQNAHEHPGPGRDREVRHLVDPVRVRDREREGGLARGEQDEGEQVLPVSEADEAVPLGEEVGEAALPPALVGGHAGGGHSGATGPVGAPVSGFGDPAEALSTCTRSSPYLTV